MDLEIVDVGDGAADGHTHSSKQPPPVYIEDSATQTFLNWATSAGIQFPKLKPATFSGVRGLAASSDIQVDDVIVSVPRGKALTLPPKQRCPCPEFVSAAYWDASPWYVKLAVRLLHEQGKGQQGELREWLQQLPRRVDSPVNWSQELVQQLRYSHLIHKVTEQQQEWSKLYDKFQEAAANKGSAPSKQEFFRALSLVRSRTFSGPYVASSLSDRGRLAALVGALVVVNTALGGDLSKGFGAAAAVFLFNVIYEVVLSNKLKQYAMCPVIDLLNHSSYNTTEVSYDYPRDAFLVSAGAAYVPGQQVFISYGSQNNDSLMQMYGFAEPDNPYDVYVMSSLLKWLEQLSPVSQARLDRLNREGLLGALQEVVVTRQGFGAQTLQALRYLLCMSKPSKAGADVCNYSNYFK
ncbi:hypothetical protein OEZ86_009775 [Tetradesmus obliquus]|uniref:SET domain-containing protein n=1 Tax=Tetradesmus obliquus TaxID=3088 RepID=A0ABY8UNA9_TETOB|nr:hypothetical protein OEZ85_001217 [Tetradesmus obliquus]WIA43273.1 hypothetical protein OEZ86_009775 [Tetradesmus obliquus]